MDTGTRVYTTKFKFSLCCVTLAVSRPCSLQLQEEGTVPAFPAAGRAKRMPSAALRLCLGALISLWVFLFLSWVTG